MGEEDPVSEIAEVPHTEAVVSRVMRKIDYGSGRNLLRGGGLTAPWLPISGQGAKGQGRRYAACLALDALWHGCYLTGQQLLLHRF